MALLNRAVLLCVLAAPIYSQFNMFPPGGFPFPGGSHVPIQGIAQELMAAINRRLNTGFLATPQGRRLPMAVRIDLAMESGNIASEAAEIAQELGIDLNAPVPPSQRSGMSNPPGFFPGFGNQFFGGGHPPTAITGVGQPSSGARPPSGAIVPPYSAVIAPAPSVAIATAPQGAAVNRPAANTGGSFHNHGFGMPHFPYFGPPTTPSPERAGQLAEMEAERLEQLESLLNDPPPATTTAAPVTVKPGLHQVPRMSNWELHMSMGHAHSTLADVGTASRGQFTATQVREASRPSPQSSSFSSIGGSPGRGAAIRDLTSKTGASGNQAAIPKINGNPLYNKYGTTVINSRPSVRINKPDPRIMIATPPATVIRPVLNPAGTSRGNPPVVQQGFGPKFAPAMQWGNGAGIFSPPVAAPKASRPSPPLAQHIESLSSFPNIPEFGGTFVVDPTFKTIAQAPINAPTQVQPEVIIAEATFKSPPAINGFPSSGSTLNIINKKQPIYENVPGPGDIIVAEATFKSPPVINGFPSYGSTLNIINKKQPVYENVPGPGDIQMQGKAAVSPTAATKLKKQFILGGNPDFPSNLDIIEGMVEINPPIPTVSKLEVSGNTRSAATEIIPDASLANNDPIASILSSRFAPGAGLAASLANVLSTGPSPNARPSEVTPSAVLNVRKPIVAAVPIKPLTIIANNKNNVPNINADAQSSRQVVTKVASLPPANPKSMVIPPETKITKVASPPPANPKSMVIPPEPKNLPVAIKQAPIIDTFIPMNAQVATQTANIPFEPPVHGNIMPLAPLWPGGAESFGRSAAPLTFNRPGAVPLGMLSGAGGIIPTGQDWAHYYGLLAATETQQGSFAKIINEPEIVVPSQQSIVNGKTVQDRTTKATALPTTEGPVDFKHDSIIDSLAASSLSLTNYPNIVSTVVSSKSQIGTIIDSTNGSRTPMITEGTEGALIDSIIKPDSGTEQSPVVGSMIVSQSTEGNINGPNVNEPMVGSQQAKTPEEPIQSAFNTKSGPIASKTAYLYPTEGPSVEYMTPISRLPVPSEVSTQQMELGNDGSAAHVTTSVADTLTRNGLPSGLTDFNMQQLLLAAQLAMARQQTSGDKQNVPSDPLYTSPAERKVAKGPQSTDRGTNNLRETNSEIPPSVTYRGLIVNDQQDLMNLNTSESDITQQEHSTGLRNPKLNRVQSGTVPQILSTSDSSFVMATQNGDALSANENIRYPYNVLTNNKIAPTIFPYSPPKLSSDNTYQGTGLTEIVGPIGGTDIHGLVESRLPIATDQQRVDMVGTLPYQISNSSQKSISVEPQDIQESQINAIKLNKVMAPVQIKTSSGGDAASNGDVKSDQAQAFQGNDAVETTNIQYSGLGATSQVNSDRDQMQATQENSPSTINSVDPLLEGKTNGAGTVGELAVPDNTANIINGDMRGFGTMVPASGIDPMSMGRPTDMASEANFVPVEYMTPISRLPVPSEVSAQQMEPGNDGSAAPVTTSVADTLTRNGLPSGLTDFNMQQLLLAAQLAMARQQTSGGKQNVPSDPLYTSPAERKVAKGPQSTDRGTNNLRETNSEIPPSDTYRGLIVNDQQDLMNLNTSESDITQQEHSTGLRNPRLNRVQPGTVPQILSTSDSSFVMATQNDDALSANENIRYPYNVLTNNKIAPTIFPYSPPQLSSDNTYQGTGLTEKVGPIGSTGIHGLVESRLPIATDQQRVDMVGALPYQISNSSHKSISVEPQDIQESQINAIKLNKVMAPVQIKTSSGGEAASNGDVKSDQAQAFQGNDAVETTNIQYSGLGATSQVNSDRDQVQATQENYPSTINSVDPLLEGKTNGAGTVGELAVPDNTANIINGDMRGFGTMVPASGIDPMSMGRPTDMASETNFVPAQRSMDVTTGGANGMAPGYVLAPVANAAGIASNMDPGLEINPNFTPTIVSNMPNMINDIGAGLSPASHSDIADNTMGVDTIFGSLSTGNVQVIENNLMGSPLPASSTNIGEGTVDMASVVRNLQGSLNGAVTGTDGSQAGIPGAARITTGKIIDGDTMTIPTYAAPIDVGLALSRGGPAGFASRAPGVNVPVANAEDNLPSEAKSSNDGSGVNIRNDMLGLSAIGFAGTEQGSSNRGMHVDASNIPIGADQVMTLQNANSALSISADVGGNGLPTNPNSLTGVTPQNMATLSGVRVSGLEQVADQGVDTVAYAAKSPTVMPASDFDQVNYVLTTGGAAPAESIYYGPGGALYPPSVMGVEAAPITLNVVHIAPLGDVQSNLALSALGDQTGIQQGLQTRPTGTAQFRNIATNGNIDAMGPLFGTGLTDSAPIQNIPSIGNIDAMSSLFGTNTPPVAGTASFPRLSDVSSFMPVDRTEPVPSMPASQSSLFGDLTISTTVDTLPTRASPKRQPASVFPVGNPGNRNTQGGPGPTQPSPLSENNRRNPTNAATCEIEGLFEDETSCSGYFECKNVRGRLELVLRQCPFAQFWDRQVGRCGSATQIICAVDPCKNSHLSSYGQAGNCRAHWMCDNSHSWPSCCRRGAIYVPGLGCRASTSCQDRCSTAMPDAAGTNDILTKLLLLWHLTQ